MRRVFGIVITLAVLGVVGYIAWNALARRNATTAAKIPTVAAPCPQQDDMLALEGYAPGSGGTEKIGQTNSGLFGGIAGGTAGETAAPTATPALNCRALAANVERAFSAVDRDAKTLPSDGYDETARGTELGNATAIFAFVRDQIRTQAYAGAMRGGLGALMSRGGSPADKTLLLAQLLGTQGIAVRFVHATLSDADIAQVIGTVLDAPAPVKADAPSQVPVNAVQAFTGDTNAADTIAGQIVGSLAKAGVAFATNDASLRSRWASNLRDHWWLQAQEGATWVDLDPTLSNAAAGSHLGPAPSDAPANQLPDALYPTIDIRVLADWAGPSGITTQTLVGSTVHSADAYAEPVVVRVADPNATVANIGSSTSFTASITAAGNTSSSDPFQPDPTTGARLLRLRFEIETDRPGYPALVEQRTIVDRSGAGGGIDSSWSPKATAYALTAEYTGLALSGELDPGFATMREVDGVHALHALLEYVINNRLDALPRDAYEPYPIEVMHFVELDAMVRHDIESQSANHTRFYFNRPVLAFVHHALRSEGSNIIARNDFDIVDSAMDVTGTNVAQAVRDNVVRGVIDDTIEGNVSFPKATATTRLLFAAAASAGVPTLAVLPDASPPPLPAAALAAAAASLQRGAILATTRAISLGGEEHVGWWEVDPASGSTVGRLESGAGQAEVEYGAQIGFALKSYDVGEVVAGFDRCMFAAANTALANSSGAVGAQTINGCAGDAICSYEAGEITGDLADFYYGGAGNVFSIENDIFDLSGQMCGN